MEEKDGMKKVGNKIAFGVLFVAACFAAMFILMAFQDSIALVAVAAVLLLVSAFLFMNALFTDKAKEWAPQEEAKETPSNNGDGEFKLKITKHMKDMESFQKEMLDLLKKQNTVLQSQMEKLENEIYMLAEKQQANTATMIKFNKENARQMAISERETLEHILYEIKQAMKENRGAVVAAPQESIMPDMAEEVTPVYEEAAPVLESVEESELYEVSDLPGDDEFAMPEISEIAPPEEIPEAAPIEEVPEIAPPEEIPEIAPIEEIPEMPEDLDVSELFDIPELEIPEMPPVEETVPEPIAEPAPAVEPEPAPVPSLSSDPGAMMTPEDIAKLLESMGK